MALQNDKQFQMRVSEEFLRTLDDWRRTQPELPSRAEAIRQLIQRGLSLEVYVESINEILDVLMPAIASGGFSQEQVDRLAIAINNQSIQRMRTVDFERCKENPSEEG
ncbi:hypothetical protein [Shinella sp.]|uniref:hypothetical protein n=1 Tax=Shinella sp. TaxID=1870904 RepID=UPI0028A97440|nr:hypothetical protein [Shinella sp.]